MVVLRRPPLCFSGAARSIQDRSPAVNPGDAELVALAQQGNQRAFEDLVDRHKQKAYHIAFDFSRDREDAKDLSQEAFLKAFTNLKKFDGRSSFIPGFTASSSTFVWITSAAKSVRRRIPLTRLWKAIWNHPTNLKNHFRPTNKFSPA